MTTLDGKTPDLAAENIEKIKAIFPDIFEEGKIDFSKLKQDLGEYVDDEKERYNFSWNGKGRALRLSQTPSAGTLRPCPEESKNWGSTKNLYIEGDNLEVLKLLQKSYHGKVKMIYIDPPYNTGNDFVYPDDFADSIENYKKITGQVDGEGHNYSNNSEASGRYHTDWLNMMFPRLRLARSLLAIDGIIFISIGDIELANMQKICDEAFGQNNYIGIVQRQMKTGGNKGRFFSPNIDYILVYAKNIDMAGNFKGDLDPELIDKLYNKTETDGPRKGERYRPFGLYQSSLDARPNQRYYIECPDGTLVVPPGKAMPPEKKDASMVLPQSTDGCWRWSRERYLEEKDKGNLVFINSSNGVLVTSDGTLSKWNVYTKIWLSDRIEEGQTPTNFISKYENRHSAKELLDLGIAFDFAKPSGLIEYLFSLVDNTKDCIVLDFFSGSATTAHAVMQLNAEDGGNRRFIMVQLPEPCPEDSEAAKAGYKNICEIGKERIRRAGEKIKTEVEEQNAQLKLDEEPKKVPDIGFQVFKLDSSNLKKWNTEAGMVKDYADGSEQLNFSEKKLAEDLQAAIENYIPGRTEQDVVYEILLKMGFDLTWPVEEKVAAGKKVYVVALGALMLCLENNITPDVARGMAELHKQLAPETWKVVFRDNGFASDSDKVNVHEILKSAGLEEDAFTTI